MMRTDVVKIPADATLACCRATFPLGSHQALFIVGADGAYGGVALLSDIFAGKYDPVLDATPVSEVARHQGVALAPAMNVKAAMKLFEDAEADLLPVLDVSQSVIGFLTEAFARRRYIQELDSATSSLTLQSVTKV
jgi:CIC family chloride channel protein